MKTQSTFPNFSQLAFVFLFLALLFSGLSLNAQTHGRHQTLLGSSPLNGGFGSMILEVGITDGLTNTIGGGGGLVFRNFFFGLYGSSSTDALSELFDGGDISGMDLAQGGLWIGCTPNSYNAIHPYFSLRAGWGVLDIDFDDPGLEFEDLDQVFVATPEIGLEFNLTRWMRLGGTVGYRYISGINDETPIGSDDLNGLVAGVTLRLGWFGSNRYRYDGHDRYHRR